jgi:hypothetical protein
VASDPPGLPAPGWYRDDAADGLRFWDGTAWTNQVRSDALPPSAPPRSAQQASVLWQPGAVDPAVDRPGPGPAGGSPPGGATPPAADSSDNLDTGAWLVAAAAPPPVDERGNPLVRAHAPPGRRLDTMIMTATAVVVIVAALILISFAADHLGRSSAAPVGTTTTITEVPVASAALDACQKLDRALAYAVAYPNDSAAAGILRSDLGDAASSALDAATRDNQWTPLSESFSRLVTSGRITQARALGQLEQVESGCRPVSGAAPAKSLKPAAALLAAGSG